MVLPELLGYCHAREGAAATVAFDPPRVSRVGPYSPQCSSLQPVQPIRPESWSMAPPSTEMNVSAQSSSGDVGGSGVSAASV